MRNMSLLENLSKFQLDPRKIEVASRLSRTRTAFSVCPSLSAQDIILPISRAHASSRSVSTTRQNVLRSTASSAKHDPVESNKSSICRRREDSRVYVFESILR